MKFTPHILGAVAVVAIAGAVSGATIGDSPVLKRGLTETMPEAPIVRASNSAMRDGKRPPDHYPLKTPDGTIEVAELSLHGRMRDRGGDLWWEGRDDERAYMDAGYDFYETASPERIEHERRLLAFHGSENVQTQQQAAPPTGQPERTAMTRAEAPMALAEPAEVVAQEPAPQPADEASIGNSRTIDVSAALARRD
ncbi:hypothetical protein K3152_12630 [Qipengyuania sp. 1NDH17]|uniref:Secreted protein n=1 Tax=Qipengyuania polymorpha TaxID=2867234 RepID=A0ABS7IZU8_9SPHN|nr:hypothetical protein [Qipengyuania polymorpha]MBX7459097.1 hypothetical protein [Qipengyuania polymorpha]